MESKLLLTWISPQPQYPQKKGQKKGVRLLLHQKTVEGGVLMPHTHTHTQGGRWHRGDDGMGGGMIAGVIMGVLVIVGVVVAIVMYCKQNDGATQDPLHTPTTHVNNQMFDASDASVGNDGSAGRDQLPAGAFVASTLDTKTQHQHLAQNNPNFREYSTPNIPTAAEPQARAAGGAVAGASRSNSTITYATAAPEPSDAYDGVTYNDLTVQSNENAGVQYRPIYDNSANGGEQDPSSSGNDSSTYNTVGAAPAVTANPSYAQPLSKDDRLTPQAPTLPVRGATQRAKCERPSPKGGTCKNPQIHDSKFCNSHVCPADGCQASKSSSDEYCPHHAASSGGGGCGGGAGSGGGGISRKARDGSTYDGFGGGGSAAVDHYGSSAGNANSKGVMRGQKSVYAGFNEDEEV